MERYSKILNKTKREIVLLKGRPCKWGKCSFCDYISDNSTNDVESIKLNSDVLSRVTGEFGVLEVINSGNIFELPRPTLEKIKELIEIKNIHTLFFESHWIYKKKINSLREYFSINCIVKTGLETFNTNFRENILIKGFNYTSIDELKSYFDSVCLMVGIQGQTKESISLDIKLAMENFDHFTVNVYVNNSTPIKADNELIKWFTKEYSWLNNQLNCDVLWVNTDFGVGD
jgi:hypothetical protein